MSDGRVERRLAAIPAVDVAGYSRLMGEDEEGTWAALRAVRRELADPKIAEHRGRIVKTGLVMPLEIITRRRSAARTPISANRGGTKSSNPLPSSGESGEIPKISRAAAGQPPVSDLITMAERRIPVRIGLAVPPGGLGHRQRPHGWTELRRGRVGRQALGNARRAE